jgi:hypothetical protein
MLTTEEITRVYAMYLGGQVRYAGCTWDLRGVDSNEILDTITIANPNDGEDWTVTNEWDKFQLILKDLSDITDEDALNVAKMIDVYPYETDRYKIDRVRSWLNKPNIFGHESFLGSMSSVFDFLRSRSYHLPYKNINLFEAGIAIKESR